MATIILCSNKIYIYTAKRTSYTGCDGFEKDRINILILFLSIIIFHLIFFHGPSPIWVSFCVKIAYGYFIFINIFSCYYQNYRSTIYCRDTIFQALRPKLSVPLLYILWHKQNNKCYQMLRPPLPNNGRECRRVV